MNIVFMGTPDFAVKSLEAIANEVIAVFTNEDRPKGRGHKVQAPSVKITAQSYNIPVFQPKSLRDFDVIEQVKSLKPDLIVVVAYGKLLPKEVLAIPQYGCINLHGSLLPKYRGAAPIQWSVLNGDTVTGVTTMLMDEGLDTGDMLLQSSTVIGENETASQLYERLSIIGASLLVETIEKLKCNQLTPIKQEGNFSLAKMLSREMSPIDFTKEAQLVHNHIRGLSEWPCATMMAFNERLKVFASEISDVTHNVMCGEILESKDFLVACGNNTTIKLLIVQPDNGKRVSGKEYIRRQ